MEKCTCREGRKCKTGPWWSHQSELNHHPVTSVQTHNCNFLKLKSLQDAIRHKARREEGGRDLAGEGGGGGGGVSGQNIKNKSLVPPFNPPPPPPSHLPTPSPCMKKKEVSNSSKSIETQKNYTQKNIPAFIRLNSNSQGCLFFVVVVFSLGQSDPHHRQLLSVTKRIRRKVYQLDLP